MRILFMHHGPLDVSRPGRLLRSWTQALVEAGHEVRALLVTDHRRPLGPLAARTVVCNGSDPTADLPFGVPSFAVEACPPASIPFGSLDEEQLRAYRDQLRRYLDAEVDQFDPHVVHAQHVWIGAQLALETGVPYIVSAWSVELAEYDREARYRRWVEQAAENAARVLAEDETLKHRVATTFELSPDQLLTMTDEMLASDQPEAIGAPGTAARQFIEIYQSVLDDRFGKRI